MSVPDVPELDAIDTASIVGEQTDDKVVGLAHDFAEDLDKTTWESEDKPGFVGNRVLMPWINEGIRAYEEGELGKKTGNGFYEYE